MRLRYALAAPENGLVLFFFSLVILKRDATERPSIIWKKKSGFFKNAANGDQTAAKRRQK
jgi:hypothetical protein